MDSSNTIADQSANAAATGAPFDLLGTAVLSVAAPVALLAAGRQALAARDEVQKEIDQTEQEVERIESEIKGFSNVITVSNYFVRVSTKSWCGAAWICSLTLS